MTSRFETLVSAFKAADDELVAMLMQEADKRVAAQIDLLKAGDARATGLVAAGVAIAVAGVAIAAGATGKAEAAVLFWTAVGLATGAMLSTVLGVWALWPCKVEPQGWDPDTFIDDAKNARQYSEIKIEAVALLQRRVDKNRLVAQILGSRSELSLIALSGSPICAFAASTFAANQPGWGILLIASMVGLFIWLWGQRQRRINATRTMLELPKAKLRTA